MTRRAISGGPYPAAADFRALCADPEVNKQVLASMQAVGAEANLKGFEQVKAIHLHPEPFTVDNGLFTPTFKLKRPQARTAFKVRHVHYEKPVTF